MKNKKSIIALLIVAIIGIVGLTLAYFSNSDTIENEFITKEYGSTYTEEFVSPDNWLPGDTTNKTVVVENTGEVDEAVRISYTESWTTHNNGKLNGWIHPDGTKSIHTTETELSTDESVAIINLANTSDWTKVGDYYYYNYKLAPGESTSSFLESVTFNSKTKLDDTCVTTIDGSTRTVTCNSSGDDYDNATYKLTFTIETVQYNKYSEAWGTSASIAIARPAIQTLLSKTNSNTISNYTDGDKHEMYMFNHEATAQTAEVTDYRYIGNDPYNYVSFNCDNNGTNCEVWRIIGMFDVERPNPNDNTQTITERRMKLVRGSELSTQMKYNTEGDSNWENTSLQNFLNGDYYNRTGEAENYGLKESARNMIEDATFYIGGNSETYGTVESIYAWERGTNVCCSRPTQWVGKIALMYPTDEYMVYGNGVNNTCYNGVNNCIGQAAETGWIYNSNKLEGNTSKDNIWLLSPFLPRGDNAYYVNTSGSLDRNYVSNYSYGIRPTFYLKSSVIIVSGTGQESDPYKLSL